MNLTQMSLAFYIILLRCNYLTFSFACHINSTPAEPAVGEPCKQVIRAGDDIYNRYSSIKNGFEYNNVLERNQYESQTRNCTDCVVE
jgi:hypothetical protein